MQRVRQQLKRCMAVSSATEILKDEAGKRHIQLVNLLLAKDKIPVDKKFLKFSVPARAARLLKVRRTMRFCRFGTSPTKLCSTP